MLAGVVATLAFLTTGQLMRHHTPPLIGLTADARLMFRSRHIYILASALVNLMLGLYLQPQTAWRGLARNVGSVFVLISPLFLLAAFATEPARGFRQEMWLSSAGLYVLFAGSMLHLASAGGQTAAESKALTQSQRID